MPNVPAPTMAFAIVAVPVAENAAVLTPPKRLVVDVAVSVPIEAVYKIATRAVSVSKSAWKIDAKVA